jgi:hypothetical protein
MALGTTIPANLIKRIIPVLMDQVDALSSSVEEFIKQLELIPGSAKCNDPKVVAAKEKLQSIYDTIQTIKQGLNTVNQILPVITTVSNVASTLSTIQLAIPAVPGVPTGPVSKLISTFDNLGKNCKSSVSSLQGMISAININFGRINQLLAKAVTKLSSICNAETFNVTADIQNALNNLSDNALSNRFPSLFYREINVSDDDIQSRLDLIRTLLESQLNVLQNLKEAPSKVLSGLTAPAKDLGDIGDYYVDADSQIIYGPKTSNGWGTGVNI